MRRVAEIEAVMAAASRDEKRSRRHRLRLQRLRRRRHDLFGRDDGRHRRLEIHRHRRHELMPIEDDVDPAVEPPRDLPRHAQLEFRRLARRPRHVQRSRAEHGGRAGHPHRAALQIDARFLTAAQHAAVAIASQADHAAGRRHDQRSRMEQSENADANLGRHGCTRVTDRQCEQNDCGELHALHPLILSLSKDERSCSWFDKLTTSDVITSRLIIAPPSRS